MSDGPVFQTVLCEFGVRSVCWSPKEELLFAACGRGNCVNVQVYSIQQPVSPLLIFPGPSTSKFGVKMVLTLQGFLVNMEWLCEPTQTLVATDETGQVIWYNPFTSCSVNRGVHITRIVPTAINQLAYNTLTRQFACCSESGQVTLLSHLLRVRGLLLPFNCMQRSVKGFIQVAHLSVENDVINLSHDHKLINHKKSVKEYHLVDDLLPLKRPVLLAINC